MAEKKVGSIACPFCGKNSFLMAKPRFDGFRKVGMVEFCSGCGHEFQEGDRPSLCERKETLEELLGPSQKPSLPQFLGKRENLRFCMYCEEYVKHPFTQRCMKHQREIEATDSCPDFQRKE